MELLFPILIFLVVFGGILYLSRRSSGAVAQLNRHEVAAVGVGSAPVVRTRSKILTDVPKVGLLGQAAAKAARREVKTKSAKLLLEAGSPMPLSTYLLLRAVFMLVLTPLAVVYALQTYGLSRMGVAIIVFALFAFPRMPQIYLKRKARKRARAIETAMPDAMDLLVVCVEGGLSLDGALQQVAQKTEGVLATEIRRLQSEISNGMSRRDAFHAVAKRSQSQSLTTFCTTMIQADKLGMSIATTLRTLVETMRTKRRQKAEEQARKAPIKMLPFLVIFMIPSLFTIILGPAVIAMIDFFSNNTIGK